MPVGGDSDATRSPDGPSASPDRIGPYHLLQKIGEGGMGDVWVAEQREPVRRTVALKIIKAGMDTRQVVARFEAERQALAVMDHPAIAKVLDAGATDHGRPYFVMEYVKGEPITAYCDREQLSVADRLALFVRVCEGVQHAHQKGIIHRDLKPSNVLVMIQDGQPVPKIIDFGIAKATAHRLGEQTVFTELGTLVGTPEYMSPEQAEMGGLDVDTRTDIYSLGVLLYELLTGSLPFESKVLREKTLDEVRRTIREFDPPRPSTRVTRLGSASTEAAKKRLTEPGKLACLLRGDLDWITMKALEKARSRRYDTAMGLVADIRRHLRDEPVTAGPPSTAYRTSKFVRRHRFGVTAAATVVLLLVAFGATMAVQARRIALERDRANREAAAAKQVSDFLVGLFGVSDPSEARGRTITAREVLGAGAKNLDNSLSEQPAIRARLLTTVGKVYTSLGLYQDAEPLLRQAASASSKLEGEDDVRLDALNALADVYWYQSNFTAAEPLYRAVLDQSESLFGPRHRRTLKAKFDLASLYIAAGRLLEGERLAVETMEAQRQVLGSDDQDTLSSINNVQALYFRQRRYNEALSLAIQVLESRRRVLGQDAPFTLLATHNLATVYDALGRVAEAEPLYLRSLERRRSVLGENHPDTCRTELVLAMMYRKEGRYAEAEPLAIAAWKGYVETFSATSDRAAGAQKELVSLYQVWGNPDKAAEWRKKLPPK